MKSFGPVILMLVAIGFAGTSCGKKTTMPVTRVSIAGSIRDGTSGVSGIQVEVHGTEYRETETGADGSYRFDDLPAGIYTIQTAGLSSYSISPAGRIVDLPSGNASGMDFRATPAARTFTLTGDTRLASDELTLTLGGDGTGTVHASFFGTYVFRHLIIGDYTITPSHPRFRFDPPSRSITGHISFSHPETGKGTLGSVTLAGVGWDTQDARPFFEITDPPVDGVGTIRARRRGEVAAGMLAAYDNMWETGGTVLVELETALGTSTIQIRLGPNPTISTASSTFLMAETLTPLHGNDFVLLP